MNKSNKKKKYTQRFTLIEALVAIAILLIAVVEPLSLTANSVKNANFAKDQITSFYLAQEGIEFVRNKRDTNVLNGLTGTNWLSGLENCLHDNGPDNEPLTDDDSDASFNKWCTFDVANDINNPATFKDCSDGVNIKPACTTDDFIFRLIPVGVGNALRYGLSTDESYQRSTFRRFLQVYEVIPGREASIVTFVGRTGGSGPVFTIRERIFNWIGYED